MIKIVLADDHQIVRHGLRTLLSAKLKVMPSAETQAVYASLPSPAPK